MKATPSKKEHIEQNIILTIKTLSGSSMLVNTLRNIYKDNFIMVWLGVATTSFLAKLHNLHPQRRPLLNY